jgi:hypothetical protein
MRYQVLYDGKKVGEPGGVRDCATMLDAKHQKMLLIAEGWRNVMIWDTHSNSMSELFRF